MKLSKRLETVLSLIPVCEVLADIGTDHGYIPIEAVSRGIAQKAVASDINCGPLLAADKHITDLCLDDKIETRIGDGLSCIIPGEAQVIVITGMGGRLISDIISKGIDKLDNSVLILSPQSEPELVRGILINDMKYVIEAERCLCDDGKYYFIIKAIPREISANTGLKSHIYSKAELKYGNKSCFDKDSLPVRGQLLNNRLNTCENIINKLRDNSQNFDEQVEVYQGFIGEINDLKELLTQGN